MSIHPNDLESLIISYFDEGLSASDQARLAELLETEPEAQQLFQSYMRLEGTTLALGQAGCISQESEHRSTDDQPVRSTQVDRNASSKFHQARQWIQRIAIGGVALALGFYIAQLVSPPTSVKSTPVVGHFSRIVAAEWVSGSPQIGSDITLGTYQLTSGLVEFEFNNGATVILEGPAQFDVTSAERTFLHHGRVRTRVPAQAYGFTIDSNHLHVVDLGTECGMEVNPDGAAEVHVFDGEVEIVNRQDDELAPRLLLAAGQGIRMDDAGVPSDIVADVDAFVDQLTFESRAEAYLEEMTSQLKAQESGQRSLMKKLRQAEAKAKQSPQLQKLRKSANEAKQRWIRRQQDSKLRTAIEARDTAKANLDQLYRDQMNDDEEGRRLVQQLDEANVALTEAKQRISATRKNGQDVVRSLHYELRQLQKERNRVRAECQKLRSRLGNNDQAIRKAQKQLAAARKRVNKQLSRPEYAGPRSKAEKRRKAYLAKQRELLSDDKSIDRLRKELNQSRRQTRKLRQDIQQARQATSELFAIQDEI